MQSLPLKVFVISLERATERRAHMQRLLTEVGLEAEFVSAVDGRAMTAADLAQYDSRLARRNYRSEMTNSEIACYLSHYRLYERIWREALPVALILEDDIDITAGFVETLKDLLTDPDPEWAVVRLQTQRGRVAEPETASDRGRLVRTAGNGGLYQIGTHVLGGCAYLISGRGARAMLDYGRRISRPIDQTMDRFWENGIVPYVVRPFPVRQHPDFQSEIGVRGKAACPDERASDALVGRVIRAQDGLRKRIFRAAVRHPAIREFAAVTLPWPARISLAHQSG